MTNFIAYRASQYYDYDYVQPVGPQVIKDT
jgi:hypothetical protein